MQDRPPIPKEMVSFYHFEWTTADPSLVTILWLIYMTPCVYAIVINRNVHPRAQFGMLPLLTFDPMSVTFARTTKLFSVNLLDVEGCFTLTVSRPTYERNESRSILDSFFCCLHAHQNTWDEHMTVIPNLREQCRRLGIDCEGTSNRALTRKLSAVELCLMDCNVPNAIIHQLKENAYLPYPSVVRMDENAAKYQADMGRRFEVSLLMFKIHCCSCCGLTRPYHADPLYPKESPLPKLHFNIKYYDAWECNCLEACKGQQFYGVNRPVMISAFKSLHNNIPPDVFICGIAGTSPNAKLCHDCYFEYNKREGSDISDGE